MNLDDYLELIRAGNSMSRSEAESFLSLIIDDSDLPDEKIAAALNILTDSQVAAEEVCGFVDAMRARMVHVPYSGQAIDTCGTGGDRHGTFNISTAAAILLSAGGVNVAKHGNRAATSKCGSADVLEALGIPVDLTPEMASKVLSERGFVFLFAPLYHPSLKRLIQVRRQLGRPTVFNLLGPLLNPAGVKRQVVGTFSLTNAELLAEVMSRMDYEHAIVLTSEDGLDEASLDATVDIFEIKGSTVTGKRLQASDYGLEPAPISALSGGDAGENARLITAALNPSGELNAHQRITVFNAALGFYVSGQSDSVEAGIKKAKQVLASGAAAAKLKQLQAK
ncbi:MAG TPA: anthranilate phosphoribosyltransferase [Candidatus Saccharimonadales bacterium]